MSRVKHHVKRRVAPLHAKPKVALLVAVLLMWLVAVLITGLVVIRAFYSKLVDHDDTSPRVIVKTVSPSPTNPMKLKASIEKVSYSDGEPGFEPMENYQFVILQVNIVHNLDKPIWLTPLLQSYIVSPTGEKYTMSPISMDDPFDARLYKVGESAKGGLSYMIPKNLTGSQWCYEIAEENLKTCLPVK